MYKDDIMKKLIIEGGRELSGSVRIGGAKNSAVALIPATILTKGKCVIRNVIGDDARTRFQNNI